MKKKNSRFIAIETLHQLDRSKVPLPILFQKICSQHQITGSDRALAMNLIYGVLRQYQYLDLLINKLCRQPLRKLHPLVHRGLAVGLYQTVFLSRIPESAAVNETVNAVKAAKVPKRLHGFVNGVLREYLRQQNRLPRPEDNDDNNQPVLNHPSWLTERWAAGFGREEMLAICRQNNRRQPLTLRVNSAKLDREKYLRQCEIHNIEAYQCQYAPAGVILPQYQGAIQSLPGYGENWFQVQGEAAQLATLLLGPFRLQGRYLDGCAGLGGKTGHLLQLLTEYQAELTAIEPEPHRYEKLQDSFKDELALNRITLFRGKLQDYARRSPSPYDGILLDAPCSGTGVTGRQPDIRWRRKPADISRYAVIQRELLETASSLLLPGGVLIYATCSLEPEENKDVIDAFLAKYPKFTLEDCTPYLPAGAAPLVRAGCFHPRPSDKLDGFFAARLVRRRISA